MLKIQLCFTRINDILRGDTALFFMHLSSLRFWAFCFFIRRFFRLVERKHPKNTVKCFFSSTLSICVNRFKLQYIFLKAVLSK